MNASRQPDPSMYGHGVNTPGRGVAGFALVATVSMMVLLTLLALAMLSLSTIEQRASGDSEDAMRTARANARMALMIALGELQQAAGPDQRVTATATLLDAQDQAGAAIFNGYTNPTLLDPPPHEPEDGRRHWVGVWDTSNYSPADPDNKTFVRWLVSGNDTEVDAIADAGTAPATEDLVIFEGADAAGTVKVPKVEVATTVGNSSYYAYWVEDQGVKADLAWNEGSFTDADREQAARLSALPGVDHGVFGGPFETGVSYPLEESGANTWLDKLDKAFGPADMALVMGSTTSQADWLQKHRHDIGMNVRGVMADVKKGGLRRDLSLAFEMDGTAESENAVLFNQQTGEFVGNGDTLSSPHLAPATSLYTRYLFRDHGPDPVALTPGAGNPFSEDITQPLDFVCGPSWWLLRDYANLYKRMKTSASGHALSARAYFPNRSVTQDLVDLHSIQGSRIGVNHETVSTYRPLRASYAPVLLAVNGIFSLKYEGDQLKLVVDPFYIIWNPYNTGISAEKFAITWQHGFMGGVKFQHTFPDGTFIIHGRDSGRPAGGSNDGFVHYVGNKTGATGSVSYLISDLTMGPGEVMIFSPPDAADRSADANEFHDELFPGMNYTITSGIEFNEFPDSGGGNWAPITVPSGEAGSHTIGVHLSLISRAAWNLYNHLETSLPASGTLPNELNDEPTFGDNLSGWEFSTNAAGTRQNPNLFKGRPNFTLSYLFSELSATKRSFGMISMLTQSSDWFQSRGAPYLNPKMEVFSQLNVTPILRTRMEKVSQQPFNLYVNTLVADGINNLMNNSGVDIDAFDDGSNGFYGKNYGLAEGDKHFPLLDIPKAPMHSLVQFSGANIGRRIFEPTNAIGNSWKPPYIPQDSIYWNSRFTYSDVFWQANDALFDRYYLSGIAAEYTIDSGGYSATGSLNNTLKRFFGIDPSDPTQTVDPATAQANPVLEPHIPAGKTAADIVTELTPTSTSHDGYKKVSAYSMIKGTFNVNSTSIKAWAALLKGNRDLALESAQGTTDSGAGTPFPLASTTSNTSSNNGWEKFSRLADEQIWDDNDTPDNYTDDTGLAVEIVNQVKARGPFTSISDFVNRRIAEDKDPTTVPYAEDADPRAYMGTIQEAIEQAGINGDQSTGIRANTSDLAPNYAAFNDAWKVKWSNGQWYVSEDFPFAADPYLGNRNCATGTPIEVNQANILLPLAPRLSARSDTFKIRAYGEVRNAAGDILAQATCEAVVQRIPEYVDPKTDEANNEPWDDDSQGSTLNATNQKYGRRFEIRSFRWLNEEEV